MICPCKDCQDRKIGCHSSCIKYKEFHEEREEIREVKALEREFLLLILENGLGGVKNG